MSLDEILHLIVGQFGLPGTGVMLLAGWWLFLKVKTSRNGNGDSPIHGQALLLARQGEVVETLARIESILADVGAKIERGNERTLDELKDSLADAQTVAGLQFDVAMRDLQLNLPPAIAMTLGSAIAEGLRKADRRKSER